MLKSADHVARYDDKTILLHWLTALLIITLWCVAQIIDWFPTPQHVIPRSVHVTLGVALVIVLAIRVWWRASGGRRLPPAETGLLQAAATSVHYLLYALVIAELVLGLSNTWIRGDSYFGLFKLPGYAPLRRSVGQLHGLVANIILIVAGLHALAALAHHYVLRDNVLRRMLTK
jgi:cytochrome b561